MLPFHSYPQVLVYCWDFVGCRRSIRGDGLYMVFCWFLSGYNQHSGGYSERPMGNQFGSYGQQRSGMMPPMHQQGGKHKHLRFLGYKSMFIFHGS